jgi:hypothetical protein
MLLNESMSVRYCRERFAHYGSFAHLPLRTALIVAGNYESKLLEQLNPTRPLWRLIPSEWDQAVKDLDFEGHRLFNYDDYCLFYFLSAYCSPVTDSQLEADRCRLLEEANYPRNITRSHAKSLLKAIDFWKRWHGEKYLEWRRRHEEALDRLLGMGEWEGVNSGREQDSQEDEGFYEDTEGYSSD